MQKMRLDYPLDTICALFDVSRSGYYTWLKRKPGKRAQEESRLVAEIKASHQRNRKPTARNGSRMIWRIMAFPWESIGSSDTERSWHPLQATETVQGDHEFTA